MPWWQRSSSFCGGHILHFTGMMLCAAWWCSGYHCHLSARRTGVQIHGFAGFVFAVSACCSYASRMTYLEHVTKNSFIIIPTVVMKHNMTKVAWVGLEKKTACTSWNIVFYVLKWSALLCHRDKCLVHSQFDCQVSLHVCGWYRIWMCRFPVWRQVRRMGAIINV